MDNYDDKMYVNRYFVGNRMMCVILML